MKNNSKNIKIYGVVYKIENIVNRKVYIGQTINGFDKRYCYSGKGIERVYKHHKDLKNRNRLYNKDLLNDIEKYGFDSFKVNKKLDVAYSQQELYEKEVYYIKKFNSFENGYNHNTGGSGNHGLFGEKNSFYGKHHSKDTIEYLRKINTGKHPSEDTRRKMSLNNKRFWKGKHIYAETKLKISKARKGRFTGTDNPMYGKSWKEGKSKEEIEQILKLKQERQPKKKIININTGKIFESVSSGAKYFNIDSSSLSKHLLRKNSYCGFDCENKPMIWFFYDEYLKTNKEDINELFEIAKSANGKRVICTTTNKIFHTGKEGAEYYNCCYSSVNKCCLKHQKTAGKLDDGTPLKWMYYNEYLDNIQKAFN